jgi:FAD binding domain
VRTWPATHARLAAAGCGDAIDLSWKLAATLAGWGGPNLLRSYAIERRQIGARPRGFLAIKNPAYRRGLRQY